MSSSAFAKAHDVNDASRGTLNSFAWMTMTLHVLQLRGVLGPLNLPESDARALAQMTTVPNDKRLQLGSLHTPDRCANDSCDSVCVVGGVDGLMSCVWKS
jgi:hypothetical protein